MRVVEGFGDLVNCHRNPPELMVEVDVIAVVGGVRHNTLTSRSFF